MTKHIHPSIVGTIGVLLTISALGVGTFVQQIISASSESSLAIPGQALVAQSMKIDNGQIIDQPSVLSDSDGYCKS
jgi:hypothetical protein